MTDFVRTLRDLNIAVVHPFDRTAEELRQQLSRIGCVHDAFWPPPKTLAEKYDVVFVDMAEGSAKYLRAMITRARAELPTIIAIVGYENPSVLAQLSEIGAHGILTKPLRAIGVMSAIVMARQCWSEQNALREENEKIRRKLETMQTISDAKRILMQHHGVDDREAYEIIRKHAMSRRTTTVEIAQAIITADDMLSNLKPAPGAAARKSRTPKPEQD